MKQLTLTINTYFNQLSKLIESGVTFTAEEKGDKIIITFDGGY